MGWANWRKVYRAVFCAFFLIPATGLPIPLNTFELPAKSAGAIAFYLDVCQFAARDDQTVVELTYSMGLGQFASAAEHSDSIRFDIQLRFFDGDFQKINEIAERKSVFYDRTRPDPEDLFFIDLKRFLIAVDTLHIHLAISNPQSGRRGEIKTAVAVRDFRGPLSLSDAVFISHIQRGDEHAQFVRGGLTMLPNPSRLFRTGKKISDAPIYFEINHLSYTPDAPTYYALSYAIMDLTGKKVLGKEYLALPVKSENASRVEKISLRDFETGAYRLELRVTDLKSGQHAMIKKYFRVYSEESGQNLLLPMTKADVEKYYDQIKFIASDAEKKLFRELDPAGKQSFLLQFWKSLDPDPATPENEFMVEHFTRIAYCNEHFTNGINSDRGRVYMQYGAPLDIRREYLSNDLSKPVEIWTYALEGTSEFVFVDRAGGDQFVLVHSSHPNEYHNPDWQKDFR